MLGQSKICQDFESMYMYTQNTEHLFNVNKYKYYNHKLKTIFIIFSGRIITTIINRCSVF